MKVVKPSLSLRMPTLDLSLPRATKLPDLGLIARSGSGDRVVDAIAEIEAIQREFAERRLAVQEPSENIVDSQYWFCLCFESREQKDELLRSLKLTALGDKHIDGLAAAKILGVPLKTPAYPRDKGAPLLSLGLPMLDLRLAQVSQMPSLGLLPIDVLGDPDAAPVEKSEFTKRRQTEQARFEQMTDSEYWCCVCFESNEQKAELLRWLKLDVLGDRLIDGLLAAEILGVTLTTPRVEWAKIRSFANLAKLAREE